MKKVFVCILMMLVLFCGCNLVEISSSGEAYLQVIRGDTIHVRIGGALTGEESVIAGKDLHFTSESKDVEVKVMAGEKMDNGSVVNYSWTLKINDPSAGTRFQYRYSNFDGLMFIRSEEYMDETKENCAYAIDREDHSMIAFEISEAKAHDAQGNPVKCWYEIEEDGNVLTECLAYDKNTKFPVVIE